MAMLPYPHYGSWAENPSILVSNDGNSWQVPPGLINPIIYPPNPGCNADTDIVYNDDTNELWVYFMRYWSAAKLVKLTLMKSSDGVHWSEPEYLITWYLNTGTDNERSYAIIKQGSDWHYWAESSDALHDVYYRYSTDGKNWSEAQNIVFSPVPEFLPWHLDVIYVPDRSEYWMLFNCPDATGGSLFLAKSRDRLNWTPALNKVLSPSVSGWDNDMLYRSTLLYDSNSQLLRIWYSADDAGGEWHIGYTQTEY
jgi:hypothetical protein